jgi:hypothetical protein
MPKSLTFAAIPVFLATSLVWIAGVSNHTFLVNEIGLYVGIFLIPATLVCVCSWLIFHEQIWRRVVGLICVLPCIGVWVLSLLLVYNGFKIH